MVCHCLAPCLLCPLKPFQSTLAAITLYAPCGLLGLDDAAEAEVPQLVCTLIKLGANS